VYSVTLFSRQEAQMDDVVLYLHLGMKNDWENSAKGE